MSFDIQSFIQTIMILLVTAYVGYILKKQIKSQREIIEGYKGLVEATDPEKIIFLHDREVAKLKQDMQSDIDKLKQQIIELGSYVDHTLNHLEWSANSINQPEIFNRDMVISHNMPNCSRVLASLHSARLNLQPQSNR